MSKTNMSGGPEACLVVSHYNAWPADRLLALLEQTKGIPSGVPFRTRVVVNQAVDKQLELPRRHNDVEIFHRPNTGYNIGAWDHGWRQGEPFRFYMFLQEECVILKENWMKVNVDAASDAEVGLVGESLTCRGTWQNWREPFDPICRLLGHPIEGNPGFVDKVFKQASSLGIDPGRDTTHLQSLILTARRDVLERIDGFPSWPTEYWDAVCAEYLISKAVVSAGMKLRQTSWLPFTVISHPQWKKRSAFHTILDELIWKIPWDVRHASVLVKHAALSKIRRIRERLAKPFVDPSTVASLQTDHYERSPGGSGASDARARV